MPTSSTVRLEPTEPAVERGLRARQRQKLIEACISALYEHGPSRTTIDKVVSIAGMSPGIVNFYFDTKAALLMAALEFLAIEFEQKVLAPVEALRATPVAALERLIALYLDPELASPRKVSVWYAFWGEANSRREYYDVCGKKDDQFAALVKDLVGRLIDDSGRHFLDADGVALGLIGALEILWQGIAFQEESQTDRAADRRRCLAYLNAVFPGLFGPGATAPDHAPATQEAGLPGWAYRNNDLFATERETLFFGSWQFLCQERAIPNPGDYATIDMLGDRAFIVRGQAGQIRAYRNACTHSPHAIARGRLGHFPAGITCSVDGAVFDADSQQLVTLPSACAGGLVFVRLGAGDKAPLFPAPELPTIANPRPMNDAEDELDVDADWKVVVENWLRPAGRVAAASPDGSVWRVAQASSAAKQERIFVFPNVLLRLDNQSAVICQVQPLAAGRCRLRRVLLPAPAGTKARTNQSSLAEQADLAASTQTGLTGPGYAPPADAGGSAALARFRHSLRAALPALR
jgi:TetR/AcrR family transcriptional repressor of bet genes